ncbi:uncharacterized protein KIAA0895-like [Asterias rubens]|uniref:uncharacterized protein KIAA0895-like n=1 Tax=Asterias rubens TaxID=7604 RepID=UPI0014554F03|nr:uncharacterized protein KIAA0895-like [Asterias rubens]
MRRRRKALSHGSTRARQRTLAPDNGLDGRGEPGAYAGEELDIVMPVPMSLEQVSVVCFQPASHKKCDRILSGTIQLESGLNLNSRIASGIYRPQHSAGSRTTNQGVTRLQRSNSTDETLSMSSRTSSTPARSVKLPTLTKNTPKSNSSKSAIKPCRKNLGGTSSGKTTKSQPNRTKKELANNVDLKPGSAQQGNVSGKPPKKPRSVPLLAAITPDNVEEEKAKFFSSNYSYNPQFTYKTPPSAKCLQRHGKASDKLIQSAIKIFKVTLERFKTYKKFETSTGGRPITTSQFTSMFHQYLAQEGLVNKVALNLSVTLVARALMTRMNGRPTLNVRPNILKSQWSDGLLRHEIGTHYIRSANNCEHPWSSAKVRRSHRIGPVKATEEGIASLHSVLLRKEPVLFRSAMLYYSTYTASKMSFVGLFADLGVYVEDPDIRWEYCLRAKRGQVDTSKPGCFKKDQVYLEGALKVLRYRHVIDFHTLYKLGKVALEDVENLKGHADLDSPNLKIPTFMEDLKEYRKRLDYIMLKNGLNDEELAVLYPEESPCKAVAVTLPVEREESCDVLEEAGLSSDADDNSEVH